MKRLILLFATMVATMVVASGVALAVTKIGTDGPDHLKGTNKDDILIGKVVTTYFLLYVAMTPWWAGRAKTWSWAVVSFAP